MIRLAGFFAGAALAVASILMVLGVPELSPPEPEHVIIPYEPPEPVVAPQPETEAEADPPALAETPVPEPPPSTVAAPVAQQSDPLPSIENAGATQWYSFWSPFRSQIAANGFVRRLESVTGFDYRVVKVDAGNYEVAFAYSDDTERAQKLSTIAAATGLELPET